MFFSPMSLTKKKTEFAYPYERGSKLKIRTSAIIFINGDQLVLGIYLCNSSIF